MNKTNISLRYGLSAKLNNRFAMILCVVVLSIVTLLTACTPKPKQAAVEARVPKKTVIALDRKAFQMEETGKGATDLFTLKNSQGTTAYITNYGARLVSLWVADKDSNMVDVVLGYNSIKEFMDSGEKYFGATIGRYANRIGKAKFTLNGKTYKLAANNGPNNLHGGPGGFHHVIWEANQISESTLQLKYLSKDGEEGFPGNLQVSVTYALTEDNTLVIDYEATTDKPTVCNLTNHAFFNLNGEGTGSVNDHVLMIPAERYTPVDTTLIPTGELASVQGTPFDFRTPTPIGARINEAHPQLLAGGGYDHNFVISDEPSANLQLMARIEGPMTRIQMEVQSNQPGLQFYGGNFMNGTTVGKQGKNYDYREAFCLETQLFPDSPNQKNFPTALLNPGQTYRTRSTYKFTVVPDLL